MVALRLLLLAGDLLVAGAVCRIDVYTSKQVTGGARGTLTGVLHGRRITRLAGRKRPVEVSQEDLRKCKRQRRENSDCRAARQARGRGAACDAEALGAELQPEMHYRPAQARAGPSRLPRRPATGDVTAEMVTKPSCSPQRPCSNRSPLRLHWPSAQRSRHPAAA